MIIAVGSFRGFGATTTAFALASAAAALHPDGAWLVEADPAGGVLAGRVHLAPFAIGGLERVAFPTDRATAVEALHEVAQMVGQVSVVTAPADSFRAFACHQPRLPWIPALRELTGTVVVDVGRMRAGTPAWPLLQSADQVLLVTSAEVSAVVASDEWLRAGGRVSPSDAGLQGQRCQLVVVESPSGIAFPRSALSSDLGDRCVGWLPWDPNAVDLLHRGAAHSDRRLRRSSLVQATQLLATKVLTNASNGEAAA